MLDYQRCQSDRLSTQLLADDPLTTRCLVALVKQQICSLQYAIEPAGQLFARRNLERYVLRANFLPCTRESLGNRRLRRKKRLRNLGRSKSAKRLQRQCNLRLRRDQRMAACEHQPQAAIPDFRIKRRRIFRLRRPLLKRSNDLWLLLTKPILPPNNIQREIPRGLG